MSDIDNEPDDYTRAIHEARQAIAPLTPDMLVEALYTAWSHEKINALVRDLTIAMEAP